MKKAGILIMLTGLGLTIFTADTFSTKEKVADIGKIEISRYKPHYLRWSPLMGVAVLGIGGVFVWQSYRNNNHECFIDIPPIP